MPNRRNWKLNEFIMIIILPNMQHRRNRVTFKVKELAQVFGHLGTDQSSPSLIRYPTCSRNICIGIRYLLPTTKGTHLVLYNLNRFKYIYASFFSGFHEAISEAISLSVSNPKHMQTLGLVLTSVDDVPHNINFLFHLAMDKLTFLPFSLALDMWRWDIFGGYTRKERYNCHWWDLRYEYDTAYTYTNYIKYAIRNLTHLYAYCFTQRTIERCQASSFEIRNRF